MSLASRGTAPDQRVKKPSLFTIFVAHSKLCLYSFRASIDCILPRFSISWENYFMAAPPCFDCI